jgi:hypothetical protein
MASVLSALLTKYDALTASAFPDSTIPPAFEDRAPEIVNGTQLYPPYTTWTLQPGDDLLTFESDAVEELRLTVTAFATSQDDADQIISAIRFNGQNADQYAGFDSSNSLPALTDGVILAILPARPPYPQQAGRGREGSIIKKTTWEAVVSVQRT